MKMDTMVQVATRPAVRADPQRMERPEATEAPLVMVGQVETAAQVDSFLPRCGVRVPRALRYKVDSVWPPPEVLMGQVAQLGAEALAAQVGAVVRVRAATVTHCRVAQMHRMEWMDRMECRALMDAQVVMDVLKSVCVRGRRDSICRGGPSTLTW